MARAKGPRAIQQGYITAEHIHAMRTADSLMEALMASIDADFEITAHHACAAYFIMSQGAKDMGKWRAGTYMGIEHSWVFLQAKTAPVILDVYPVSQVRPMLISLDQRSLAGAYAGQPVKFTFDGEADLSGDTFGAIFRRDVEQINKALLKLLKPGHVITPGSAEFNGPRPGPQVSKRKRRGRKDNPPWMR